MNLQNRVERSILAVVMISVPWGFYFIKILLCRESSLVSIYNALHRYFHKSLILINKILQIDKLYPSKHTFAFIPLNTDRYTFRKTGIKFMSSIEVSS